MYGMNKRKALSGQLCKVNKLLSLKPSVCSFQSKAENTKNIYRLSVQSQTFQEKKNMYTLERTKLDTVIC